MMATDDLLVPLGRPMHLILCGMRSIIRLVPGLIHSGFHHRHKAGRGRTSIRCIGKAQSIEGERGKGRHGRAWNIDTLLDPSPQSNNDSSPSRSLPTRAPRGKQASRMPLYLVKLVSNTLINFRYAELDECLDFLGVEPRQAYDRCVGIRA